MGIVTGNRVIFWISARLLLQPIQMAPVAGGAVGRTRVRPNDSGVKSIAVHKHASGPLGRFLFPGDVPSFPTALDEWQKPRLMWTFWMTFLRR
jgi:hypothetical protein